MGRKRYSKLWNECKEVLILLEYARRNLEPLGLSNEVLEDEDYILIRKEKEKKNK